MPLDDKHALLDEALRQLSKLDECEAMDPWRTNGKDSASGVDVLIMTTWREQRESLKEKLHLYFTDDGEMHTFWYGDKHPLRKTYDDLRYLVHEFDGFEYAEDSKLSEFEDKDWCYVDLHKNDGCNVGLKKIGKAFGMKIPKTHRDCDEKECCYQHKCVFAEYVKQLLKETKHPDPDLEEMGCGGDIDWTPELEVRLEMVLAALVLQAAEEQREALLKVPAHHSQSEWDRRKRARLNEEGEGEETDED